MQFAHEGQERGKEKHVCLVHGASSQLQNTEGRKAVEHLITGERSLGALRITIYCGQPTQQVQVETSFCELQGAPSRR